MSMAPEAATVEAEAQTAHHGTLTRNGWIGLAGKPSRPEMRHD